MSTVLQDKTDATVAPETKSKLGFGAAAYARVMLVGAWFGVILVKSEVVRWQPLANRAAKEAKR